MSAKNFHKLLSEFPTPNMQKLPDELLQCVFDQLHTSSHLYPIFDLTECEELRSADDRLRLQTLFNVSLANKKCSDLARPALYHTLNFSQVIEEKHLSRILYNLFRYPKICALVRIVVVSWVDDRATNPKEELSLDAFRPQINQALKRLILPQHVLGTLEKGVFEGVPVAELFMVLAICPKLQRVALNIVYQADRDVLMTALFAAARSTESAAALCLAPRDDLLPFRNIKEIELKFDDWESVVDFNHYANLVRFPALKTVTLQGLYLSMLDISTINPIVESLHMTKVVANDRAVKQFLKAFPALKVFQMRLANNWFGHSTHVYPELGNILRRHGSCLATLRLESFDKNKYKGPMRHRPLGRLSSLSTLKHLFLPINALFQDAYPNVTNDPSNTNEDGRIFRCGPEDANDSDYLVNILPVSIETLYIDQMYNEKNLRLRDAQMWTLMQHPSFDRLDQISFNRAPPFSYDLTGSGWQATEDKILWDKYCNRTLRRI